MSASKKPLADTAQRRRIVGELTKSLLVEAAAGSGKTHEMAARMAAGVAQGVYDVEQMAAVTFTRKAAAELRGRFQLALELQLATLEPSSPEQARVRLALTNIERFFSGTIHAFCARLLRERPIEAHVAPGFTELDDVEERLMREASWRDFRAKARADGDPDLALLSEAGIKAKDLDGAFATVCLYEDIDFPAKDVPAPETGKAWSALGAFWKELSSHLPLQIDDESTCKMQQRAQQFERAWAFAQGRPRTAVRLAELLAIWASEVSCVQKWWSTEKAKAKRVTEEVKTLQATFRADVVEPWLDEWRRHLYAPCIRLLTRGRIMAADDRRRRNALSFNDLLLLTAEVLREHSDVRRALQAKYRWIFVDEFQDTDPVQAEIMFHLSDGGSGALYVVGDPKQSIYRFRRADIDIYNQVRARLGGPKGEGLVSLTSNFRSVPSLCNWANRVFAEMFPEQPSAWDPAFAPLAAVETSDNGGGLFKLTIASDHKDVPEDEAASIARYIRSEVNAGRRAFGDFLILTKKRKGLQTYVDALEALQIPVEVSGAGAFGESRQVQELSNVLQALADPQDGVALVGVLRGPLFGVSDPDLFAWRSAGGYFGLFAEPPTPGAASFRVATSLEALRRWHRWTRILPAGAALERILEDSGYLALSATTSGGVEAGDLLHAVDRVRAAVEAGFTLAEAAEALQDAAQESSEVESWPLEPGRADVVRLMNLHKAKGLEAPVVFLANPVGGFKSTPDIRIERQDGAKARGYLPIFKTTDSFSKPVIALPPDWPAHEAEEQKYLDAEAKRLLYVAATRAKHMLVVGRWTGSTYLNSRSWIEFEPFLGDARELSVPATAEVSEPVKVDLSLKAAASALSLSDAEHERARQPSWSAASVSAETKHVWSVDASETNDAFAGDPTRVLTASTPSRRSDAGVAWGTLVHGLLEQAMRFPLSTRDDLRRLALWLTVEEPDLRPFIDEALDTVQAVAGSEWWGVARAAGECHEEAPLSVLESNGALPKVLTGTIDLIYQYGAKWQVVDYKTDADGATVDLSARYAAQISAYERAWKKIAGGDVASRIVWARGK